MAWSKPNPSTAPLLLPATFSKSASWRTPRHPPNTRAGDLWHILAALSPSFLISWSLYPRDFFLLHDTNQPLLFSPCLDDTPTAFFTQTSLLMRLSAFLLHLYPIYVTLWRQSVYSKDDYNTISHVTCSSRILLLFHKR